MFDVGKRDNHIQALEKRNKMTKQCARNNRNLIHKQQSASVQTAMASMRARPMWFSVGHLFINSEAGLTKPRSTKITQHLPNSNHCRAAFTSVTSLILLHRNNISGWIARHYLVRFSELLNVEQCLLRLLGRQNPFGNRATDGRLLVVLMLTPLKRTLLLLTVSEHKWWINHHRVAVKALQMIWIRGRESVSLKKHQWS